MKINNSENITWALLMLFLISTTFACVQKPIKENITKVSLGSTLSRPYCVDANDEIFYYYDKNQLFRLDFKKNVKDSTLIWNGDSLCVNVVGQKDGVAIISFEKKYQYQEHLEKSIKVLFFDKYLSLIDTMILKTVIPSRLIDEDFNFVNLYYDKANNTLALNSEFGYFYFVEGRSWSFIYQQNIMVDPITGKIYHIKPGANNTVEITTTGEINSFNWTAKMPVQCSVFNGQLMFYSDGRLFFGQLGPSITLSSLNSDGFGPMFRNKNGVFKISHDTLIEMNIPSAAFGE